MFGFEEKRSKGSHHIFENAQGQSITIPKKLGRKVKRIYLKQIIELLDLQAWENEQNEQPQDNSEPESSS